MPQKFALIVQKKQHKNYSGKKKCHTTKAQIIVSSIGEILNVNYTAYGRMHDFTLFKSTDYNLKKAISILADSGYQGMAKLYPQAQTPIKSSKNHKLNKDEKEFNHHLSSQRMLVENIFAKFKVFKVLSSRYRNHLKRLGLRLNLIAGIINRELGF